MSPIIGRPKLKRWTLIWWDLPVIISQSRRLIEPWNVLKFNVSDNLGKNAITKVSNIKTFHGSISLLDCEIITGRTHQIRVHLLSLGLPIIGDKDYSFNKEQRFRLNNMSDNLRNLVLLFPRQALHSHKIEFDHPILEKHIIITCDLPDDMKDLNNNLQWI